ncbi:MAG TPA: DPP IV N-terminal domain-containing protein, partial [Gammaproteobacteria bacterium]|nr:DPP IV N-terminal domain-containing protein [Gammaproteobacteria bacterium]
MNCRIVLAALALVFLAPACRAAPAAAPSFTQPALSPDGRTIAFVSGGDIWSVAASGGDAHLLIAGMGNVSRPLYSPDGGKLAFESDKTGNGDIYVLDFAGGGLTRVTYADSRDELSGWSHDGRWLYFDSSRDNIGGMNGVYRVRLTGGTPMPVSLELYRNEEEGVPAPDDKAIALVGGGWGSTQWWRHGSAHIDHGAIWLLANDGSHKYRRITPDDARALWPMWSPDGRTLYYMSDRGGIENIWRVGRDGTQDTKVTHFSDGRVLWPTIAANGHAIAFVRGFDIWTLDLSSGKSSKLAVTLRGAAAGPAVHHETLTGGFSELALSPDGKKLAFVAHGEVFAAPAAHGKGGGKDEPKAGSGPATRITHTPAGEFDVAWAPNSNELVYSSERDGPEHLFLYDFRSGRETRLTSGSGHDTHPEFSPDGKLLAFVRDGKDLCVLDLASHKVRTLAKAEIDLHHPLQNEHPFAWSPDGRWIAYLAWGARMYRNVEIVPAAGGKSHAASFLGNTFADPVVWSPDGKSLFFATGQRTEPGQIARVDLVPRTPKFREEQFLDLFKEETPPALPQEHNRKQAKAAHENASSKTQPNKPVKIDFDGIARRLSLLPVGLDVQSVTLSPDGKQALLTAEVAGRSNLYVWSLDELANEPPVARQLTSTPGDKSSAQYAPDGKSVYYLDNGKAYSVDVDKGDAEAIPLSAEMDVDFNAEKEVDFAEAWRWLRNNFHDPKMNGVDWNAVRKEYAPQVAGARTPAELYRLLNRLVGELNASHSGVRGGGRPERITGRLGLRFDPTEYERRGRFRIAAVVPLSPAAVS